MPSRKSPRVRRRPWRPTLSDVRSIKRRLLNGDIQHDIAADHGINQGRISEINTGKKFGDVPPAD